MNDLLNKLFGLDAMGFGSQEVSFAFLRPVPSWAWVLVLIALCTLAWWSYRGLAGKRLTRAWLAAARALLIFTVLLLAAGPMLQRVSMHTENDSVLILLDRSTSLDTPDLDGQSRNDQLVEMLHEIPEPWTAMGQTKRIAWHGFNDRSVNLATGAPPAELSPPGGKGSNIGGAISSALDAHAATPIAGLVLVSDGRSTDELSPELINRLISARIAVYAVGLGAPGPIRDASITGVQAPDLVFADDRVPIRVDLQWSGIDESTGPITLDLVDHTTSAVLQSVPVNPEDFGPDAAHRYTLLHTLDTPGEADLEVVLNTKPGADMNRDNNRAELQISTLDRPLRVLYIDGYPRWEQRYLKNLLTREDSVEGTVMLLAADRRYVQDGDVVINRIPTTKQQWGDYDAIILGDVRPELFTPAQLEGLIAHIADNGAGLLWIGGPSATPDSWLDSPIAGLLPMHAPDPAGRGPAVWDQPVTMASTPEADRLGVLQLGPNGWADRLSDPSTGWSQLRLVQRIDPGSLKPGVAVLADALPIDGSADTSPVVMTMRYASGRIGYVATDETWRWRYGRGEDLPERFWLPTIRMLARGTIARGIQPAILRTTPSAPEPGRPVQLTVELLDQSLIETVPSTINATISRIGDPEQPPQSTLVGSDRSRVGSWIPDEPGRYRVTLDAADPLLGSVSAEITVLNSSDERRTLDTDHDLLRRLASETSGQFIEPTAFDSIPAMLPNRARTIALPPERLSLWDRPIVLLALIVLLTCEWIGRKALRLA